MSFILTARLLKKAKFQQVFSLIPSHPAYFAGLNKFNLFKHSIPFNLAKASKSATFEKDAYEESYRYL